MIIISLIEEHIFPILDLIAHSVLLENARWADAMLLAKLFPKLTSNLIT
jgi:hypothetical protein